MSPRSTQFQAIKTFFNIRPNIGNDPHCQVLPTQDSLFVWGPSSSGKTYVLSTLLREIDSKYLVEIDGFEIICGVKPFLKSLLESILGEYEFDTENIKCENEVQFVSKLTEVGKKLPSPQRDLPMFLVVDATELLRNEPDVLYLFVRLKELTGLKIFPIFVSKFSWNSYFHVPEARGGLFCVHFPQYTKKELIQIVQSQIPDGIDGFEREYHDFVGLMIQVHYSTCRNVKKLLEFAHSAFQHFLGPIKEAMEAELPPPSIMSLWLHMKPCLARDFKKLNSKFAFRSTNSTGKTLKTPGLPKYAKYLLIAAYIASRNPPSSDKRYFVKGRAFNRRKTPRSTIQAKPQTLIPHSRLIGIFFHLVESKTYLDSIILAKISDLCAAGLLIRYDDSLNECKYKCAAQPGVVQALSQSLNIELKNYLVDGLLQ